MSLTKKFLTEENELTSITEQESKYFKSGRSEGAPYLFYKHEEFCDLMGHEITYYPTGVLLSLKDSCKYFNTSKSFVFYNNNGAEILNIHNLKSVYDHSIRANNYIEPSFDIEVEVYKDYVYIKKTDFSTNIATEYLVDVATGEKITTDFIDGEQLSFNL